MTTHTSAPTSVHLPRGARDARLDALVRGEIVDAGVAPCAVVGWGFCAGKHWRFGIGAAGANDDAIFDLASVTKPLTAIAAARLVAAGALSFDATVAEVLPELDGSAAAGARLGDLLSHRAGLPAWGALYRSDPWSVGTEASAPPSLDDPSPASPTLLARAASRIDARPIGADAPPLYSDLGYVLAGAMIARASNAPLDVAWSSICGATSARRWRAHDPTGARSFDARVLPTEHVPWRGGDVRGVVHDENAFFLERSGGDPGHAGAFATVDDLAHLAVRFLDSLRHDDDLLPPTLARAMIAPHAIGSNRLGWDGVSRAAPGARPSAATGAVAFTSQSGTRFGPRAFGHLGFTGTSVWIDPDARVFAILLTNRTYPSRANVAIRAARPRVHDALFDLFELERR